MIAMISWQGSWKPPYMSEKDLVEFGRVVKIKGVGVVASLMLPFPWPMVAANIGGALIAGLLAWPIGDYGDNNHISVASGTAVALGMLALCLILSSLMVVLKHIQNRFRLVMWLRSVRPQ